MIMARQKNDGRGRLGGRKKGTPNKSTGERRELIDRFLNDNWDDFCDLWKVADPDTKLKIYMDLLPYSTPKMASVDYKVKVKPLSYKDELDADSGEITR